MLGVEWRIRMSEHGQICSDLVNYCAIEWTSGVLHQSLKWIVCVFVLEHRHDAGSAIVTRHEDFRCNDVQLILVGLHDALLDD